MKEADFWPSPRKNLRVYDLDIKERPGFEDLINLIHVYRILSREQIDVVHGHGAKGGLLARLVAFFLRARSIYTPHGGSLHRVHGRLKNFIYDAVELALVPFTNLMIFESKYSQDMYFQNVLPLPEISSINYNGVRVPGNLTPSSIRGLKLVSFGLLRHLKGHDIVIRACALLRDKGIPFSYTIFGKGEEKNSLLNLIGNLKLEEFITIRDYTDSVIDEMKNFSFLVQPSRFESFGYVPAEAMANGLPVVSSLNGGLAEVVTRESGLIATGNTPEEYASIFESVYKGKDLIPTITSAYERVSNLFDQKKMVRRLAQIYAG